MAVICYSDPISTIPTNESLEKISDRYLKNLEMNSRIYRRTDGHNSIDSACHFDHLCIYFIESPTFSFGCYKFSGLIYPVQGIKILLLYMNTGNNRKTSQNLDFC